MRLIRRRALTEFECPLSQFVLADALGLTPIHVSRTLRELRERKRREAHIRMLLRELAHRSKNLLAVVLAIAKQTAPRSPLIDDYLLRLTGA